MGDRGSMTRLFLNQGKEGRRPKRKKGGKTKQTVCVCEREHNESRFARCFSLLPPPPPLPPIHTHVRLFFFLLPSPPPTHPPTHPPTRPKTESYSRPSHAGDQQKAQKNRSCLGLGGWVGGWVDGWVLKMLLFLPLNPSTHTHSVHIQRQHAFQPPPRSPPSNPPTYLSRSPHTPSMVLPRYPDSARRRKE